MSFKNIFCISCVVMFFVACSDDSSSSGVTNVKSNDVDSYATIDDLPNCTPKREGVEAFVKDKNASYICSESKWKNVGTTYQSLEDFPNCTEKRKNESAFDQSLGKEFVCDGESWNANDAVEESAQSSSNVGSCSSMTKKSSSSIEQQSSEKEKYSSSNQKQLSNGNEKSSSSTKKSSSSTKTQSSSSSQQGISQNTIISENKTIRGISMLIGANISLYELDGKTLTRTGKSFSGTISNDEGEYSVANVNHSLQYALLEATGYYYDALIQKKSTSKITLNALVDLLNRDSVNINFMTHLEYERILELVTKEKIDVKMAKQQAQKEVFSAFGIDSKGFAASEDLNVNTDTDGNSALFAITVLLYNDMIEHNSDKYYGKTELDLTSLLKKLSNDLSDNGKWDDDELKAYIADKDNQGLCWEATNGNNFIKAQEYAHIFFAMAYGLGGACTKERMGVVAKNKNEKSKRAYPFDRAVYFKCVSGENGDEWLDAKQVEIVLERGCAYCNRGEVIMSQGPLECGIDGGGRTTWIAIAGKSVLGTMVDPRDKKEYKTVSIGIQTWMAENLNYETENSLCYNDSSKYCAEYGRYYNLDDAKKVCPNGWHLPTPEDWDILFSVIPNWSSQSSTLRLTGDGIGDYKGSDDYSFSAISAGYVNVYENSAYENRYIDKNKAAYFWVLPTEYKKIVKIFGSEGVTSKNQSEFRYSGNFSPSFNVRCIKD